MDRGINGLVLYFQPSDVWWNWGCATGREKYLLRCQKWPLSFVNVHHRIPCDVWTGGMNRKVWESLRASVPQPSWRMRSAFSTWISEGVWLSAVAALSSGRPPKWLDSHLQTRVIAEVLWTPSFTAAVLLSICTVCDVSDVISTSFLPFPTLPFLPG